MACAPFFVAVMVGIFFKEKQGVNFFVGFVIAITGVILISLSGEKNFHLNPYVILNFLFLGLFASALGFLLWNLATSWIGAVKTSLYIYVSPIVTVVLSLVILHEKMTVVSVIGAICILAGLLVSQGRRS